MKKMFRKTISKMKCQYTKMLCISFYCLLTTSCGKKIQNTGAREETKKQPLFANTLDVQAKLFRNGDSIIGKLTLTNDAWIKIPGKLKVLEGNSGNQKARLYFNILDNKYEFFCEYQGGADTMRPVQEEEVAKGQQYILLGCYQDVDFDGILDYLNYSGGTEVAQDAGADIAIEVLGADDREDNATKADIDVEFR